MQDINAMTLIVHSAWQSKKMNEVVFNATKQHTDRLLDLIRTRVIANTKISDCAFEKIKYSIQIYFTALVTDLIEKDFPNFIEDYKTKSVKKNNSSTPYNTALQKLPLLPSSQSEDKLNLSLNYRVETVFMVPFFIAALASRDQQKAISIATKEVRDLITEVNRLIHYKEIIESPRTPREKFVLDILIAIDKLKKTPGKLTILKISKEFTPKRTTFYGMLEKHRIEINTEFQVIDKKTNKPFEFS